MDHRAYIRIVEDSDTAVLMIHGIAGSPAHFRDLIPVIPADWSVYNILLDGHGGTVSDFSRTSLKKWKAQVHGVLTEILEHHRRVLLVAHSMGTLFSIQAAIDHPDRIPALFLLGVPTRPWVRFSTMLTCLRVSWGNLKPNDHAARAMADDCSIRMDQRLWLYIPWAPRFLELLAEIRRVRGILPDLTVPTLTFQSRRDELVSLRSCRDLENYPAIRNTVLEHSGHFGYGPEDLETLRSSLAQMISQLLP